jgi:putative radical SAM enzyme (TIGR03279 family)
MPKLYGWVREVVPESPADLAGIQPGDLLRTINDNPVRDLVDYEFYAADEELTLGIDRNGRARTVLVAKAPDDEMGIRFGEEPAPFIRICANKCVFCFVKGLPERHQAQRGLPLGMRETLYIKDDDYRYSFLFGNFITLTNLKEADWRRLEEQRLSPLYVSVHTTNPELRRKMVDGPRSGEILDQIRRLGALGITCHTQLVLCPEINDGEEMERSIADLAALRPIVESISAVPVGLTKYNNMLKVGELPPMRPYRLDEAQDVMARVERWQRQFAAEPGARGLPFIYLSDEWYYVTKHAFPPARHYGGYAQIENGVGMTRKLLDDWRAARKTLPATLPAPRRLGIVTSMMARPVIERMARDLRRIGNIEVRVMPIENRFFGPIVTVAGLLCGQDVLEQVNQQCGDFTADDLLLVPRVMLDNAGKRFLDDVTVEDFRAQAPARVTFARTADEIAEAARMLAGAATMPDVALVGGV